MSCLSSTHTTLYYSEAFLACCRQTVRLQYKHLMPSLYFEAFNRYFPVNSKLCCCALETCRLFVPAAPHRSSQRICPGCRAAARGGGSHGPERFGWMAAASCCSVLGSGEVNLAGSRKWICTHAKGF